MLNGFESLDLRRKKKSELKMFALRTEAWLAKFLAGFYNTAVKFRKWGL